MITRPVAVHSATRQSRGRAKVLIERQIIHRYFELIGKKDVDGILELFADADPVVYEPFSTEKEGLRGKDAIKSFLRVAVMANEGLKRKIDFANNGDGSVTAEVTFERGTTLHGRFTFSFVNETGKTEPAKKIKSLRIRFI